MFPQLVAQLEANLINIDGVRTGSTRRTVIDVLKQFQHVRALQALLAGQAAIATTSATLTKMDPLLLSKMEPGESQF